MTGNVLCLTRVSIECGKLSCQRGIDGSFADYAAKTWTGESPERVELDWTLTPIPSPFFLWRFAPRL